MGSKLPGVFIRRICWEGVFLVAHSLVEWLGDGWGELMDMDE